MTWTTMVLLLFVVAGCHDEKDGARPTATVPPSSASVAKAPVGRPPDDEPVVTVDDTIPEPAPAASSDDGKGAPTEAPEEACAPEGEDLKPIQLLRFAFTSGIEGKDPKDALQVARPGQRVYAHLTLRNRSGRDRCAKLTFRVAGKKRTEVTLKIGESWSWRTWAFNTIKPEDRGPLELVVTDGRGEVILQKTIPVVAP